MEASKRERIILLGVVPVTCAILGAVATVIATNWFASDAAANSIASIISDPKLSADQKLKLIELLNANAKPFWTFLSGVQSALIVPTLIIAWALADWIRRR